MVSLDYDHADFHLLLKDISAKLGTEVYRDVMRIPASLGRGHLQAVRLPNGLSVLLSNLSMDVDIRLHRLKKMPAFYILAFDQIFIRSKFEQNIDNDKLSLSPPIYSGAALHSTLFDNTVIASKGCRVNSVRIIFDPRWLARYFGIEKEDELLLNYIYLKSKKLILEPLDTEYKKNLDEIFSSDVEDPVYFTIVENRIMLLIERFMNRILEKMGGGQVMKLRPEDVYKMMEVEEEITRDDRPGIPSIQELATHYNIGPTKLKSLFKEVYGYPIYEYYQRYRMDKARAMLLTGELSVKETGYQLGYRSLSNFAKAFRQVFDYAPGDIIKAMKHA